MKIAFMGTPSFAEQSLRTLLDNGIQVAGVFTQPDKPKGRGMQYQASPVKILALERGLPVYQPENFSDGRAADALASLEADLLVVVAYGKILPVDFLSVPRLGAINLHGSLLPRYRGAAPIQWAVLNGDEITGVTVQYIDRRMDAGDVIARRETMIGEFETSGELYDRLAVIGADLLLETVRSIGSGDAVRIPQEEDQATYTRMLDKSLSPIDWACSPREIVKHICGLIPWPVATMELSGSTVKVFGAAYTDRKTDKDPGTILTADKNGLEIACGGGNTLRITEIQPAGGKRMSVGAYLLGHPVRIDEA